MLQNSRLKKVKWIGLGAMLVTVLNVGGIAGCGGGSGGSNPNVNVGTGTGNVVADTSQTISASMGAAFQGVSAGIANSSQTIQCNPGGQATVSGSASGGNPVTFNLTADFNECAGLDGNIQMSGEYSSNQTGDVHYAFNIDGTVGGNGCALEFDAFGAEISGNSSAMTFSVTGSVTATCGSATVTCNYNGINSQDPAALQAACSCSGAGC
jgi:hypothetical protein